MPWAYAFLNLPNCSGQQYKPSSGNEGYGSRAEHADVAEFVAVSPQYYGASAGIVPWRKIVVNGGDGEGRVGLVVDRDLNLGWVQLQKHEPRDRMTDKASLWKEIWRPVVQRGELIGG